MFQSERRRLPRLALAGCHFQDETSKKVFGVFDVSHGGMSLRCVEPADFQSFPVASQHSGELRIEGKKFHVEFKVVSIRGPYVGAEWMAQSESLRELLNQILDLGYLARNSKKYPIPEQPETIWIHHPLGADLIIYAKNKSTEEGHLIPESWVFSLHGLMVRYDAVSGLRSGLVMASDDQGFSAGMVQLETRVLQDDEQIDLHRVTLAEDFLKEAEIPSDLKQHLLMQLRQGLAG